MENRDYFNERYLNQSSIKDFMADKEVFWESCIFNPNRKERKKTPSMLMGTLYHDVIERGGLNPDMYIVVDLKRRGTKEWKELDANCSNRILVKTSEIEIVNEAHYYLIDSKEYTSVTMNKGKMINEKEIYWNQDITIDGFESSIPSKAKIDMYNDEYIVDWKSTRAESYSEFEIEVNKYKYYLQSSWYSRALMKLDNKPMGSRKYCIIAQNLKKPHIIMRYDFGLDQINNLDADLIQNWLPEINKFLIEKQRELYLTG